jgi:hypothetical protein
VSPFNHSSSQIKYCKVGSVSPSKILWIICGAKNADLTYATGRRASSEKFIGSVLVRMFVRAMAGCMIIAWVPTAMMTAPDI